MLFKQNEYRTMISSCKSSIWLLTESGILALGGGCSGCPGDSVTVYTYEAIIYKLAYMHNYSRYDWKHSYNTIIKHTPKFLGGVSQTETCI